MSSAHEAIRRRLCDDPGVILREETAVRERVSLYGRELGEPRR
jgi:hypothetical protein